MKTNHFRKGFTPLQIANNIKAIFSVKSPSRSNNKFVTGFTLVEMMLVIVIIAILASVALVSVRGVRQSANDTKRVSDMNKAAQIVEVYFSKNGVYPAATTWDELQTAVTDTPLPKAPGAGEKYFYGVSADRLHYTLKAMLEAGSSAQKDPNAKHTANENGVDCSPALAYCIGN